MKAYNRHKKFVTVSVTTPIKVIFSVTVVNKQGFTMDLKIKDVAELLNVSETTIRRWVSDGRIPAYRIHQQYRFNRTEIEDWVIRNKKGKALQEDKDRQNEADFTEKSDNPLGNKQFSFYRALHKGSVMTDVPGDSKTDIIRATMTRIATSMNLDADVVTELLLDRENLQPTALNHGIGIPHARDFLLSSHQDVVMVVYPAKPVEYGALDGEPVHTLFFLFACNDKRHLHLLAKIAHLTSQAESQRFLRTKPDKISLLAYIKEWEGGILLNTL